ncbi:MAG: DUF4824 family protein [Acidobacteriota bacterium]|nr:MAG: DUF4824 family protein [Acidobacteriota bacterium]
MKAWIGIGVAVLVVLVANVVALIGVQANRAEADATVTLTERELPLFLGGRENTSLHLRIEWNRFSAREEQRGWFDRDKLAAVGFDVSVDVSDIDDEEPPRAYRDVLDRRAYVVLEYDGEAWKAWREQQEQDHRENLEELERKQTEPETIERVTKNHEQLMARASRLFAVDAGPDASELRQRHPDRARKIIVPASVGLRVRTRSDEAGELAERWLEGQVNHLLVGHIHVSHRHRGFFDQIFEEERDTEADELPSYPSLAMPLEGPPRYEVSASWGARHEPWIDAVVRLHPEAAETTGPAAAD